MKDSRSGVAAPVQNHGPTVGEAVGGEEGAGTAVADPGSNAAAKANHAPAPDTPNTPPGLLDGVNARLAALESQQRTTVDVLHEFNDRIRALESRE